MISSGIGIQYSPSRSGLVCCLVIPRPPRPLHPSPLVPVIPRPFIPRPLHPHPLVPRPSPLAPVPSPLPRIPQGPKYLVTPRPSLAAARLPHHPRPPLAVPRRAPRCWCVAGADPTISISHVCNVLPPRASAGLRGSAGGLHPALREPADAWGTDPTRAVPGNGARRSNTMSF